MADPAREVTLRDLGDLSMRATVAFAARCARRVRPPLDELPADFPNHDQALGTVDAAIEAAENYARAQMGRQADTEALAQAAMNVAEATYPYGRLGAFAAAHAAKAAAEALRGGERASTEVVMEVVAFAYGANRVALTGGTGGRLDEETDQLVRAAIFADYEKLRGLCAGTLYDMGDPVDPSEKGPLGPLWAHGVPQAF
jgi:hypothetical protein